jgi:hypothetical protein
VGGSTRAFTSSARIRVAQKSAYAIRIGPLIAVVIGWNGPGIYPLLRSGKIGVVSWLYIALLALAVAVVVGAEWPRLESRLGSKVGPEARRKRERAKRKASLRVIQHTDADDYAASVERDLAQLPTIEETDRRN